MLQFCYLRPDVISVQQVIPYGSEKVAVWPDVHPLAHEIERRLYVRIGGNQCVRPIDRVEDVHGPNDGVREHLFRHTGPCTVHGRDTGHEEGMLSDVFVSVEALYIVRGPEG